MQLARYLAGLLCQTLTDRVVLSEEQITGCNVRLICKQCEYIHS